MHAPISELMLASVAGVCFSLDSSPDREYASKALILEVLRVTGGLMVMSNRQGLGGSERPSCRYM